MIEGFEKKIAQYHEDDRAQRLLNVFELPEGQINVSHVNSTNHIVAWHAHQIQTDYWCCVRGAFKVGLAFPKEGAKLGDFENFEVRWEYLSDKYPRTLTIPPGVYHGYKALVPGSTMLYFLTEKYSPEDEFRAAVGAFNEQWTTENK